MAMYLSKFIKFNYLLCLALTISGCCSLPFVDCGPLFKTLRFNKSISLFESKRVETYQISGVCLESRQSPTNSVSHIHFEFNVEKPTNMATIIFLRNDCKLTVNDGIYSCISVRKDIDTDNDKNDSFLLDFKTDGVVLSKGQILTLTLNGLITENNAKDSVIFIGNFTY